jgi:hypothetical protein
MSGAPTPPRAELAAALRATTERFAAEILQPAEAPPEWSELEWAIARCAAAMQGISVLLARDLRWRGPPLWQSFLAEQREQSLLRHERIGALLEQLQAVTVAGRIGCIALKGASLRALGLYGPGERPMADVDLLVRASDSQSIASALADIGYVEAYSSRRHRVYEPQRKTVAHGFAEHIDNPLKIEVHTAVAEELPVRKVDVTERILRGQLRPGVNGYPDLPTLILHLLLNAAGDMRQHSLRQIQLNDIALIARLLGDDGWQAVLRQPGNERAPWWMFPPLALTARYYPGHVPADVLKEARAACPRVLRLVIERESLTTLSWANLQILAFPGIEWSRTPLDALRFIRSRVAPSRRALGEVEQAQLAWPQPDGVKWYGASHPRRILRWLFARPARVQTMLSVRAALESAGFGRHERVPDARDRADDRAVRSA